MNCPKLFARQEWLGISTVTRKGGELVQTISNQLLVPTAFSAAR
jgi:hypothetical protein